MKKHAGNPKWGNRQDGTGNSGNPGGSPKELPGLIAECKEWAMTYGLKFVMEIACHSDDKTRLAASIYLINRGFGCPTDKIEHSGGLSLEQIIASVANRNDDKNAAK